MITDFGYVGRIRTTELNMIQKINVEQSKVKEVLSHFQQHDKTLFQAYENFNLTISPMVKSIKAERYFSQLCKDIIGQQLAIKAADAIIGRFETLFENELITPELVLKLDDQILRAVGMSGAKVKTIKDLLRKSLNQEIDFKTLDDKSEDEVLTNLTTVWGIGPWTTEMFLIFTMARENVFSSGDLGLKKGIEKVYRIELKDQTNQVIDQLVKKWDPFKSYAAKLLWQVHDKTK